MCYLYKRVILFVITYACEHVSLGQQVHPVIEKSLPVQKGNVLIFLNS